MSKFDFKFGLKVCLVIGLIITVATTFFPHQELSQNECAKHIQKNACPGINHKISGFPLWVRHTWQERVYSQTGIEYENRTAWRSTTLGNQTEYRGVIPRSIFLFILANYLSITLFFMVVWFIFYKIKNI